MQWAITENELTECSDFDSEFIPEKIPKQIHFSQKNGIFSVLAENVSGFFACNGDNVLKIVAKYKNIDPFVMAAYVQKTGTTPEEDIIKMTAGSGGVGLHYVLQSFIKSLQEIAGEQLKIRRRQVNIKSQTIKGHVNWNRTLRNFSRNEYVVETSIKESTNKIPENIILSIAARKILPFFSIGSEEYMVLIPWCNICTEYTSDQKTIDLLARKLRENVFSGAHAFYQRPVAIAKVILGIYGASAGEQFAIQPLLFNTPILYEEFVRSIFIKTTAGSDFSCQKGFIPRSFLFSNNFCEMIPDITFYKGANIKALCDVKYKKPDAKDFYQLYAYMRYANLKVSYIITPDQCQDFERYTTIDGYSVIFIRCDSTKPGVLESKVNYILSNIN